MVGRVGYAPTTPAMSMQYSTIELTALIIIYPQYFLCSNIFNFESDAQKIPRLIANNVSEKSPKKDPDGKTGKKINTM